MLISHLNFHPDSFHPIHADRDYLYLDIETTGLSRDHSILYMIGCGYKEADNDDLHVILWFNEDGRSEQEILFFFARFLSTKTWIPVTFNGNRFDLPYLKARYAIHGLECPLLSLNSLDLYQQLKPYKGLFGLERARQKDWEAVLGIGREDSMSGQELIHVYRSFLKEHEERLYHMLVLHNYEDVCHMAQLAVLMGLEGIVGGRFSIEDAELIQGAGDYQFVGDLADGVQADDDGLGGDSVDGMAASKDCLVIRCRTEEGLPVDLVRDLPEGRIHIKGKQITCILPAPGRVMKHFFPDPENYYYLPREDRAIHKSVGVYVDRAYREKCRPGNCYVTKEGVFLPFYGLGQKKDCLREFTLYSPEYRSPVQYVEYDELACANDVAKHWWAQGVISHFINV